MNQFNHLDTLFPKVGESRIFGEVVSIEILVEDDIQGNLGLVSWKRKSAHVNASTNAFHMHRGLCSEVRKLAGRNWSLADLKAVYRRFAYLVNLCYTREARNGNSIQCYGFRLEITSNGFETIVSHQELSADVFPKDRDSLNWELFPFGWHRLVLPPSNEGL